MATVEPSAEPTMVPEPTMLPERTEPRVVLAAKDRGGEFACSAQEHQEVTTDGDIVVELASLVSDGVPGIVAATASSEGLLRVGAAGERELGSGDPFRSSDRVHLGSDTKAMTGTLLALLDAEGLIELTSPVAEIWPESHSGWHGVTLLDLLHHRGGAEDNIARDQPAEWEQMWNSSNSVFGGGIDAQAAEAISERSRFAATMLASAPPEVVGEFAYSNAGYVLVGAALEAKLGTSWESLMCEYLFRPLRMDGCGFGAPALPAPVGHRGVAGGLQPIPPTTPSADNPFALGPAGTVHCPVSDWAQYLSWVLRGARGQDDRLSKEIWDVLLEPEGQFAAGWVVARRSWASGLTYSHAGSNTQWYAIAWVAPEIDRAYLAVANSGNENARTATDSAVGYLIESDSTSSG